MPTNITKYAGFSGSSSSVTIDSSSNPSGDLGQPVVAMAGNVFVYQAQDVFFPVTNIPLSRQSASSESVPSETGDLQTIFDGLVKNWVDETAGSSSAMRRYAHSSYQAILVLGGREPKVVELILREMQNRPDMWFEALRRLTNKNPAESAKTFTEATKAWLDWGRKERMIS